MKIKLQLKIVSYKSKQNKKSLNDYSQLFTIRNEYNILVKENEALKSQ